MSETIPEDMRKRAYAVIERGYNEGLVDALERALLAEQRRTIEECAKVAEGFGHVEDDDYLEPEAAVGRSVCAKFIAAAIRSLK